MFGSYNPGDFEFDYLGWVVCGLLLGAVVCNVWTGVFTGTEGDRSCSATSVKEFLDGDIDVPLCGYPKSGRACYIPFGCFYGVLPTVVLSRVIPVF